MKRIIRTLGLTSLMAGVIAVGLGTGFARAATAQTLTSVEVTPTTSVIFVGHTIHLTATPKDQNGEDFIGATTTFTSSDPSVATVDGTTGVVSGVAVGSTTITATSDSGNISVTGSAMVRVIDPGTGSGGQGGDDGEQEIENDKGNGNDVGEIESQDNSIGETENGTLDNSNISLDTGNETQDQSVTTSDQVQVNNTFGELHHSDHSQGNDFRDTNNGGDNGGDRGGDN